MIAVDTNVIAYCFIATERTPMAQRVWLRDPDWHVPVLWRSELRNVLAGYLWQGKLDLDQASAVMAAAHDALKGREHLVPDGAVLGLSAQARLSAYDCEFVALAQSLAVPLVTEDRGVLKAFPDRCLTMEAYLAGEAWAHEPGVRYQLKQAAKWLKDTPRSKTSVDALRRKGRKARK